MIKTLSELMDRVKAMPTKRIVIAGAGEDELLLAHLADEQKIANFILIGDQAQLHTLMSKHHLSHDLFPIVNEPDPVAAASLAVQMVKERKADLPMKGLMHTGVFLRAVLDKTQGLASHRRISQITIFDGYNGTLQFLTDCAINIKPTLKEKEELINNVVYIAQQLGYKEPRVALLGAVETVSESMPDTLESAILTQMNHRGQISGCIVDGPLSLDNAISLEAARHKGIDGQVAGKADILIAGELREANTFSKALHYYAQLDTASVIVGTTSPIIMTSRTDELKNKLFSIAVSCLLSAL